MRTADRLLSLTLPCEISALESVRVPLDALTLPGGADERADLQLVVWELLTNAILHSGGDATEQVALQVSEDDGRLVVSVSDPGAGFTPIVQGPDPHRPDGRGLLIVETLALRWGVECNGRTRVWCELPLADAS